MSMEQVSLNGRIIRPRGEDTKNTGILIVSSRHITATNTISASVRYFKIDLDPEADFPTVSDTEFICLYPYFIEHFEILESNSKNGMEEPLWLRMDKLFS